MSEHDCVAHNECVNGLCVLESQGGGDGKDGGEAAEVEADGGEAVCATPCVAGEECEHGVCKAK